MEQVEQVWDFIRAHQVEMISASVLLALVVTFTLYYCFSVVQRPRFIVGSAVFADFLKESISSLNDRYWPTLWFYNSNLMTAIGLPVRGLNPVLQFSREILDTADGGQISLDWYVPSAKKDSNLETVEAGPPSASTTPVMLFLPGITGHSQAEYFRSLVSISFSPFLTQSF